MFCKISGIAKNLALFTGGGVILSLLVSWSTLYFVLQYPRLTHFYFSLCYESTRYEGAKGHNEQWGSAFSYYRNGVISGYSFFFKGPRHPTYSVSKKFWLSGQESGSKLPDWSVARRKPPDGAPVDTLVFELAAGWPWTSWTGRYTTKETIHNKNLYSGSRQSAFKLPPRGSASWCIPITYAQTNALWPAENLLLMLPLRPLFPQVLWSIGLYGAVFYLIARPLVWFRRRRVSSRRRRGRCVRCGYDLAGLGTCPECGLTSC